MKKIFCISALSLFIMFSCKKDEKISQIDQRDKFIGTWTGPTKTIQSDGRSSSSTKTITIIKDSATFNRIIIISGSRFKATVDKNTYIRDELVSIAGTSRIIYNGSATIDENKIINETGRNVFISNEKTITGNWTATLTKKI